MKTDFLGPWDKVDRALIDVQSVDMDFVYLDVIGQPALRDLHVKGLVVY